MMNARTLPAQIVTLMVLTLAAACTSDAPSEMLEPDLSSITEKPSFTPFTVARPGEHRRGEGGVGA